MAIFSQSNFWVYLLTGIVMIWVFLWKGYALWTSARMGHKKWFVAIVIFSTLGILEMVYIFYVAKKTPKDIVKILKSNF